VADVRIASLIPSGTDLAVSLGLADAIVGVSHECDNPRVRGRLVLTSAAVPSAPATPPAEVDRAVVDHVRSGEPLYRTDTELLAELRPTHVLAQDICDVCAVPGRDVVADLPPGTELVTLTGTSVAGLEADLVRLGAAVGAEEQAQRVVDHVRAVRSEVTARVVGWPRPRVLALEWGDPPFVGGHWVPELVTVAGGEHVLGGPGEASRRASWEEVAGAAADVVVFMPCGYRLGQAVDEGNRLRGRLPHPAWWATDATAVFSRLTPAAVTRGLHVLAGILHPEAVPEPDPLLAQRLGGP
jgi:iron complex transport system substrate-binding protein